MFKVGDKVKYIGPTNYDWSKWLYRRHGIIITANANHIIVKYKEDLHGKDEWWFYEFELKHIIPEYILDWEKRLDV